MPNIGRLSPSGELESVGKHGCGVKPPLRILAANSAKVSMAIRVDLIKRRDSLAIRERTHNLFFYLDLP
jgi:hypothetical protein